jgi:PrtD family type I secretion system ABC transporter
MTTEPATPPEQHEKLKAILRDSRKAMVGIGVLSVALNVLLLSGSLYMMMVYDMVLPSRSVPTLFGLAVLVLIAYVFQGVLDFIRSRLLIHFANAVDVDLNRDVHALIIMLGRKQAAGDATQPMRDLDQLRSFLSGAGPSALVDMPWMLFFIAVLFLLHPYLGITVLVGGAVLVTITYLVEKMTKEPSAQLMEWNTRRLLEAEAARRHAEVFTAMGMQQRMGDRWVATSQTMLAAQGRLSAVVNGMGNLSKISRMVLQSAVLTVGALLVMKQMATGGVIFASSILSSRALAPLESIIGNWRGFISARQSWARLHKWLAEMPDTEKLQWLPAATNKLELQSVTLGPPGSSEPTVRGVSLLVKAGEGVAILGPSGCGKSTLVRAITGVWALGDGHVRLDGAAIEQWPAQEWGRQIGYVPQNVELLEGSVAENIARFDPQATSDAVVEAAKAAGVHDLILKLPKGYNTHVGREGQTLSGGQKQRIALARALYGDPFLIVLDEPNSNLDEEGDQALMGAIRQARARGAIVIAVAHRASILQAMDLVVLMQEGRLIGFGPKERMVPHLLPAPAA